MHTWSQGRSTKAKSVDRALSCILGVTKRDVFWGLTNMYPENYDCGLPGHLAVMRAAMMEPGVYTMSDELIPQISCNIFLAFKCKLMMTSGQNISHYTTAKLWVHVWNHDLIWWQNKIDTQKHFHKTTITSSWTLSKTKIPIKAVKAQMPSIPNQKSRTRDNKRALCHRMCGRYRKYSSVAGGPLARESPRAMSTWPDPCGLGILGIWTQEA